MVSMRRPSTLVASVRHDNRGMSSTRIVQAPHSPPSQPVFVPVSPTTSRKIIQEQYIVGNRIGAGSTVEHELKNARHAGLTRAELCRFHSNNAQTLQTVPPRRSDAAAGSQA